MLPSPPQLPLIVFAPTVGVGVRFCCFLAATKWEMAQKWNGNEINLGGERAADLIFNVGRVLVELTPTSLVRFDALHI